MGKTKKSVKKFARFLPEHIKRRKAIQKVWRRTQERKQRKEKRRELEAETERQQALAEEEIQTQIAKDDDEALTAARRNPLRLASALGAEGEDGEAHEGSEDEDEAFLENSSEEDEKKEEGEEEEEEEMAGSEGEEDEDDEDEDDAQILVTYKMLAKLEKDARVDSEAFKRLVMVFRSACQACDPEMNRRPAFLIADAQMFNRVVTFCLQNMRAVLEDLLAGRVQERTFSDARLLGFMKDKNERWRSAKAAANTFVVSTVALLNQMDQGLACAETLRLLHHVVPLYGAFPAVARRFLGVMLQLWASPEELVRTLAYRNIHALAVLDTERFLESTLKAAYTTYLKHSQMVNHATLPVLDFMRDGLVELFAVSTPATYRLAFASIRQMALHLRGVTMASAGEVVATVHNFQFLNALRVWADVFAAQAAGNDALHHLLYPFVQTLLAAIDVSDGARLLGFRFHVISLLLDVCEATGVFANVLPFLLQCISYPQVRRHVEKRAGRELDFATHVVVPLRFLGTVELQTAVREHFFHYAGQFLAAHAYAIAFPELALPFVVMVKQLAADELTTPDIDALLRKVQENVQWVTQHRMRTDFSPKDVDRVKSFLATEKEHHKSPLDKYWIAQTKKFEEEDAKEYSDDGEEEEDDGDDEYEYEGQDDDDDDYGSDSDSEGEEEEDEDEDDDVMESDEE